MKRTIALLGAAAALAAPAAAQAATQTASQGNVTATFSYSGSNPNYTHLSLSITRAGQVVYGQPVTSPPNGCGTFCEPGSTDPSQPSVHVLDLEHNGSPDVLLDLFSGGAHCCFIEQVFSFNSATGTYVKTEHNFGNPGAVLKDLRHNGHLEFLTEDNSFAYAFTDYAASGMPIQILTFSNGRFHNVTRQYPKLIRQDAASWMKAFKSALKYHDTSGVVAAWAADEELLGHSRLVNRFLAAQAKAGHLEGSLYSSKQSAHYIADLKRFLRHHGYIG